MKSYLRNTINNSCDKKKYFFVGQCNRHPFGDTYKYFQSLYCTTKVIIKSIYYDQFCRDILCNSIADIFCECLTYLRYFSFTLRMIVIFSVKIVILKRGNHLSCDDKSKLLANNQVIRVMASYLTSSIAAGANISRNYMTTLSAYVTISRPTIIRNRKNYIIIRISSL